MPSRRGFLKGLGLAAVAAPLAMKALTEVEHITEASKKVTSTPLSFSAQASRERFEARLQEQVQPEMVEVVESWSPGKWDVMVDGVTVAPALQAAMAETRAEIEAAYYAQKMASAYAEEIDARLTLLQNQSRLSAVNNYAPMFRMIPAKQAYVEWDGKGLKRVTEL